MKDSDQESNWFKRNERDILDGIEVETCTFCKGTFFDRGEFESLLLRKQPRRFKFYRKFFDLD